jgi:hypothetical protein
MNHGVDEWPGTAVNILAGGPVTLSVDYGVISFMMSDLAQVFQGLVSDSEWGLKILSLEEIPIKYPSVLKQ